MPATRCIVNWAIGRFEKRVFDELMLLPLIIVAVTMIKGATLYLHTTLTNKISSLVLRDLQNAVFLSLNRADLLQVGMEAPASLAQRFYAEMIYIQTAVSRIITSLIRDTLMIVSTRQQP